METTKIKFGFSAINSGMRNSNVEPQLIATSTQGGFRITPSLSKAMGVAAGENIMFVSNIPDILDAIKNGNDELKAAVESAGIEWGTRDAEKFLVKEFGMYGIAKAYLEFDKKGNYKTTTERLSKKDKITFVEQNFESVVAQMNEKADEEFIEAFINASKEEQLEMLASTIESPEVKKYAGSKTANPAQYTGTGVSLNFTDTNVWAQLKEDIEEPTSVNRTYSVDVENPTVVEMFDGFKAVKVTVFTLGEYKDSAPIDRKKKDSDSETETEE